MEEFAGSVERATAGATWIVDGNYSTVRPLVLERATTVIWLNLPLSTLLSRAVKRTFWRLATRERLFNGNREPVLGFLHSHWIPWWVLQSYRRLRLEYAALLSSPECGHLRMIEIRSTRQLAEMFTAEERRQ